MKKPIARQNSVRQILGSVTHQNRQIGMCENMPGDTAQDQAAEPMDIGSKHEHVGLELMRLRQECFSEHARPDRKHVQFGADAVLGQHLRDARRRRTLACTGQNVDPLGTSEEAYGRQYSLDRELVVPPGNGDMAAEHGRRLFGGHDENGPIGLE